MSVQSKQDENKPTSYTNVLKYLVRPSMVELGMDYVKINDYYNKIIMAVGYPRTIQSGWLDRIISAKGDYDISMFIAPSSIEDIMVSLNNELVKQKADMIVAENQGLVNPSLKLQYEDTYNTLSNLQKGDEKLFRFSLYLNAKAHSRDKLDLLTKKLKSELNGMMIISKVPALQMNDAIQSVIPLQNDKLRMERDIPSSALSACFPFTTSFLDIQDNGIIFGQNSINNVPVILDIFSFYNYNGLVLASSGSGKSYAVKLYILRNMMRNIQTFVVDPQDEYKAITDACDGQLIEISENSESIINPLDMMGHTFTDKILSLMDLFKIMFGEISDAQQSILDKCLITTYLNAGIFPNNPESWKKKSPILKDLYNTMKKMKKDYPAKQQLAFDALENKLERYITGSFSFLNKNTKLDLEKQLITFNIGEMPEQIRPIIMFLILDFVYTKMKKTKEKKLLIIDEAWSLLRYGDQARYVFEMVKTARKYGMGMVIITQEVRDLLTSKAGHSVLANTSWKLLLRQEPVVINEIKEKFNISDNEVNHLLTSQQGEGLLFALNTRMPLKITASPEEHELVTSNPFELMFSSELKKQRDKLRESLPKFETGKAYYLKNDLLPESINFLTENGYREYLLSDLNQGRGSYYLVKDPPKNQSIEHFFMVRLIVDEIMKYTKKVKYYETQNVDIIFESDNGKKIAIEVETGSTLDSSKEKVIAKGAHLQSDFDEGFFVVTDSRMKKTYSVFGETLSRVEIKERIRGYFR